jgi:undecaprenyl phosphate N,N'-diacetylbacillosamine 1-phosphate transferase
MYRKIFKPSFDFILALMLLICISPLLIAIIIALAITQSGKIFFIQLRPGYRGRIFKIIKFKTMNDKINADGSLLPDMDRMHKTGKFLRKYSLDELPQLFNILTGNMSFVGPRPLLTEYLSLYNEVQQQRHNVKPGITGWAQVNGRNTLSWNEKFKLDIWYVKNQSFILDFRIMILTIKKIFKSAEVNAGKNETMPTFRGNN